MPVWGDVLVGIVVVLGLVGVVVQVLPGAVMIGIAVAVVHPGYVLTDMGGPDAEITPQESASGIRDVAARLTVKDTGSFWKWNGEPHPW